MLPYASNNSVMQVNNLRKICAATACLKYFEDEELVDLRGHATSFCSSQNSPKSNSKEKSALFPWKRVQHIHTKKTYFFSPNQNTFFPSCDSCSPLVRNKGYSSVK